MSQAGIINSGSTPLPTSVPTQFTTDSGISIPSDNNLNVLGGIGITTSGSINDVLINLNILNTGYAVYDGTNILLGRSFEAGNSISITNQNGIDGNSIISFVPQPNDYTLSFMFGGM